jgi:hypothetical protein
MNRFINNINKFNSLNIVHTNELIGDIEIEK